VVVLPFQIPDTIVQWAAREAKKSLSQLVRPGFMTVLDAVQGHG
jgi:hypothetical protein